MKGRNNPPNIRKIAMNQSPLKQYIADNCTQPGDKAALARELGVSHTIMCKYAQRGGYAVIEHDGAITVEGPRALATLKQYGLLK